MVIDGIRKNKSFAGLNSEEMLTLIENEKYELYL